jgi:beta-lactam-binding protein with PASTA domain
MGQELNSAMRTFLRILWMALVLLIVGLLSALTTMRLAIHGGEVTVPDFQGKSPSEARRIADDNGLAAQIEREYYSPAVPRGRILSQMPAPGTIVRRGWELRLALSLGPQRVAIPQVVGESARAAAISIEQRGLDPGSTATVQSSGAPAGQVIAQNPSPNATDIAAPKISLLVAQDAPAQAFVMPSFIGQPLGSATITLERAGFPVPGATMTPPTAPASPATSPGPQSPVSGPSPASIIVSQNPAPGAKILAGSTINFIVKD